MNPEVFEAAHTHIGALQNFQCADPSTWRYDKNRGRYHPEPYAIEVQSLIRSLQPRKIEDNELLGLAAIDDVLAGVIYVRRLDAQAAALLQSEVAYLIAVIAVGLEFQGQGLAGQLLDFGLETSLFDCREEDPHSDILAVAKVHRANVASQRLFRSRGFQNEGPEEGNETMDVWVR